MKRIPFKAVTPSSPPCLEISEDIAKLDVKYFEENCSLYRNRDKGEDQYINAGILQLDVRVPETGMFKSWKIISSEKELCDELEECNSIYGIEIRTDSMDDIYRIVNTKDMFSRTLWGLSPFLYKALECTYKEVRKDLEKHLRNLGTDGSNDKELVARKAIACIRHIRTITGLARITKEAANAESLAFVLRNANYVEGMEISLATKLKNFEEAKALCWLISILRVFPKVKVTIYATKE